MKHLIPFILYSIFFPTPKAYCQTDNNFEFQLKSYYNFTDKSIQLPKWNDDVKIDVTKRPNYLNYTFNSDNFYLNMENIAWAGNWFAWSEGGIALRWQPSSPIKYAEKGGLNKEFWLKVEKMSKEDISKLSPVEKYDIYSCTKGFEFFWASNHELIVRGPYKLPALDENGTPKYCSFCGFCNGARAAGALMPEPINAIVVKAKNHPEIEIVFYPADLKALSAVAYYYMEKENVLNLGLNYNEKISADENKLQNPNPAILDIILREYLAMYKIPLFIDVQYNSEIWNETILGFDRKIISVNNVPSGNYSNDKIKKIVSIECKLYCQDEVEIESINKKSTDIMANKSLAVSKGWVKERIYKYNLLTDEKGNIIDGNWKGEPVDFIWLGKGEGADSKHVYNSLDPTTSNYTGNSNIIFSDILHLVKLAAKQ